MQFNFTAELEALREGDRSNELFATIINKYRFRLEEIKLLHDRYTTRHVPIMDRCVSDPMSIDNRVNNDFFSEIINIKTGYFSGNPQAYIFADKDKKPAELFNRLRKKNRLDDLASETTKHCGIGGYSARLVYVDVHGELALTNLNPWECVFLGEKGLDEPEYAIHFYEYTDVDGNGWFRMALYEPYKVSYYEGEALGQLYLKEERETIFSRCNLFGYENNEELQGDAEKVLSEIDDYDKVVSDFSSELESFRSAYLALYNVEPSNIDFKQTGTLFLKTNDITGAQQKAEFITKSIQVDAMREHLDRLESNIYRFSNTPNMKEIQLGSAASGTALKFRLYALENKTASFERKTVSSNLTMLECIRDYFRLKGADFDPYDVEQSFTRNIPVDLESEMRALALGKGNIPYEKLLGQISFIEDPKAAVEELREEMLENNPYLGVDNFEQQGVNAISQGTEVVSNETGTAGATEESRSNNQTL